uniref:Uncharacterized protein n=1 Tax=Anguilla anguilla TaxID=7936 RepID=A0A0E9QW92_ANGAN
MMKRQFKQLQSELHSKANFSIIHFFFVLVLILLHFEESK